MEIDNLWKAERWEPEKLMALYKRAGAKYFFALANHHDNFDAYDSKLSRLELGQRRPEEGHRWNVGQSRARQRAALRRQQPLAHAWHWFQVAYGYDAEGPGRRALRRRAADEGRWQGQVVGGPGPAGTLHRTQHVAPDGITSIKARNEWHQKNDRVWNENPPPMNPAFTEKWFLRCQDLVDKYQPDVYSTTPNCRSARPDLISWRTTTTPILRATRATLRLSSTPNT